MDALHDSFLTIMRLLLGADRLAFWNVLPLVLGIVMLRAMLWGGLKSTTMRDIMGWRILVVTVLLIVIPFVFSLVGLAYGWPYVKGTLRADVVILIGSLVGLFGVVVPLGMWILRDAYLRVATAMVTAVVAATLIMLLAIAIINMFAKTERQSIKIRMRRDSIEQFIDQQ